MQALSNSEREIAALKQLDSVHFYDLLDVRAATGSRQAMGLLVFYGGSRILNYTQTDPQFAPLLHKVLYQYRLERDTRPVLADSFTRHILETGAVELEASMAQCYLRHPGYAHSLLPFARQVYPQVQDIVGHHLGQLFALRGQNVRIGGFSGFRSHIALQIAVEGESAQILPLRFVRRDPFHCELSVGGLFGSVNGLLISVEFRDSGVRTSWKTPDGSLHMDCEYTLSSAGLHHNEQLFSGGQLQHAHSELLGEPVTGREADACHNLLLLGGERAADSFFRLPWGGFLSQQVQTAPAGHRYRQIMADCVYLSMDEHFATVRRRRQKSLQLLDGPLQVTTDAVLQSAILLQVGGYGVVETHFDHACHAIGDYQQALAGRNFYSLFQIEDSLQHLATVHPRAVGKADGLVAGYQLLDESELHKIWQRSDSHGGVSASVGQRGSAVHRT